MALQSDSYLLFLREKWRGTSGPNDGLLVVFEGEDSEPLWARGVLERQTCGPERNGVAHSGDRTSGKHKCSVSVFSKRLLSPRDTFSTMVL